MVSAKQRDWYDKEWDFMQRWHSGTYCKNPKKYVPKKLYTDGAIQSCNVDEGGYWVWLEDGWVAYDGDDDCRQIHAYTINDLKDGIKTIRMEMPKWLT